MSEPRLQPQSPEAELHVLGGILIDNGAYDLVADRLVPEDFYEARHQELFRSIQELRDSDRSADLVSVYDHLKAKGRLEQVGGAGYLAELEEAVPSAAYVEPHARIVREKAALRRLIRTCSEILEDSYAERYTEHEDGVPGFLDDCEERVFQVREAAEQDLKEGPEHITPLLSRAFFEAEARMKDKREVTGVPTGYLDLDRKTAGLQRSDLIILAARPSVGKTALALNLALNAALAERGAVPVAIFSLEMARTQIAMRLLALEGRVTYNALQTGFFGAGDIGRLVKAMEDLKKAEIYVDDAAGLSARDLRAKCRRLKSRHNIGLVVVDYMQLMSGGSARSRGESREQEISRISRSLKGLAKELNTPVLALSQLNREVEKRADKKPLLSDLRESGSIEQDADVIMFIHRAERYDENTAEKGLAEVIIAKQRNGPLGTVKLRFWGDYMRFDNYEERSDGWAG